MTKSHLAVASLVLAGGLALPSLAQAKDEGNEAPAVVSYGFGGFWTGAAVGLAAGYVATGSHFESHEWRTLVYGAGIGGLAGIGLGITLGIVDVGRPPPRPGWLILRDTGYGASLGGLAGGVVGALAWAGSGHPKNLLTGAAIGTLVGAGAGLFIGILEGSASHPRAAPVEAPPAQATLQLGVTFADANGVPVPLPALTGTF
jgi:hypothetical protein